MELNPSPFIMPDEFAIQWVVDDQIIIVVDNEQLEEIYLMHGVTKDNRIPQFKILVREDAVFGQ